MITCVTEILRQWETWVAVGRDTVHALHNKSILTQSVCCHWSTRMKTKPSFLNLSLSLDICIHLNAVYKYTLTCTWERMLEFTGWYCICSRPLKKLQVNFRTVVSWYRWLQRYCLFGITSHLWFGKALWKRKFKYICLQIKLCSGVAEPFCLGSSWAKLRSNTSLCLWFECKPRLSRSFSLAHADTASRQIHHQAVQNLDPFRKKHRLWVGMPRLFQLSLKPSKAQCY